MKNLNNVIGLNILFAQKEIEEEIVLKENMSFSVVKIGKMENAGIQIKINKKYAI